MSTARAVFGELGSKQVRGTGRENWKCPKDGGAGREAEAEFCLFLEPSYVDGEVYLGTREQTHSELIFFF